MINFDFYILFQREVGLTKLGSQVSGFLNRLKYPSEFNSFADFYQLFFGRINVFDVPSVSETLINVLSSVPSKPL